MRKTRAVVATAPTTYARRVPLQGFAGTRPDAIKMFRRNDPAAVGAVANNRPPDSVQPLQERIQPPAGI